jgi:hypothetical protein
MSIAVPHPSPRWSIPIVVLGVIAVITFFIVLNPPGYKAVAQENISTELQGGNDPGDGLVPGLSKARIQVVPPLSTVVAPEQYARSVLVLKLGPDDKYVTVGQISSGSRVDVIGRNEKGDWLAIALTPGSKVYGWVRASTVAGVTNVTALPVTPVNLLR